MFRLLGFRVLGFWESLKIPTPIHTALGRRQNVVFVDFDDFVEDDDAKRTRLANARIDDSLSSSSSSLANTKNEDEDEDAFVCVFLFFFFVGVFSSSSARRRRNAAEANRQTSAL